MKPMRTLALVTVLLVAPAAQAAFERAWLEKAVMGDLVPRLRGA